MTARVVRGVCPTGKTRHRNRAAAIGARSRVIQQSHERRMPVPDLWIYRCPTCAGWHLTSQVQRSSHAKTR